MTEAFSYHQAFSRNMGWVTVQEQEILRHKRIAIAGMGGVDGFHDPGDEAGFCWR